jgi:hypothetical protein
MTTIVQTVVSSEWIFALDSNGVVWERPFEDATGLAAKWERLPKLPGGVQAIALSPKDNVIVAIAEGGAGLFRYLTDKWEDITPPLDLGVPQ